MYDIGKKGVLKQNDVIEVRESDSSKENYMRYSEQADGEVNLKQSWKVFKKYSERLNNYLFFDSYEHTSLLKKSKI